MEPCEALSPSAGMIQDACHCRATCISFVFLVCSFVDCFSLVSRLFTSEEDGLAVAEEKEKVSESTEELPQATEELPQAL